MKKFDWKLYPKAEKFLENEVNIFLKKNKFAYKLSRQMEARTSTRLFDWIDHIVLPRKKVKESTIKKLGFSRVNLEATKGAVVFKNRGTVLFPVILGRENIIEVCIKPEFLDKFVKKGRINGKRSFCFRKAEINREGNYVLSAVERRGYNGFVVRESKDIKEYNKAVRIFRKRKRKFKSDKEGMLYTKNLVKKVLKDLGPGRVADAFFRNERIYWQKRNKAGRVQKKRQDSLGLGWGNHDHHTYRSSRENFKHLVRIFELLGLKCRERFFAGEEAGWGAQVLEHPENDIVVFSDVDITKEEKNKDFAHKGLKQKKKLGTVGLWVALHGESILQAGMHHLEARFNFEKLRKDLKNKKVKTMKPFSYFKFLKQAFTEGERWKVEKERLKEALRRELINKGQYERFLKYGAIGSHLENLQRRQGFKGFNQESVTAIIKATDPRKQRYKRA